VKAPCPVVVTVHDFGYLRHPEAIEPARRLYYRALVPATLRHARRVVTNSQATADETAAFFPELVGRIATTRFGTPSWVWRQPGAGTAIDAAQLQSCEAPFLFVGTLEPRKNLVGLLDGYELFRGRRELRTPGAPVPPLQIVGARGWRNRRIRRKLASLRDRGWVSVTDYCEPDALWRRYRSARALLFPSLYEGFGFPILEAMAAGLPVLTSNRGAMAEVAGDAALLVDPVEPEAIAAALECFHADGRLLAELAARGCTRARSWDWRTTARATLAVYDEILKEGRAETEPSRRI
jgi:glycosyltransferase involved in cell wall biosynthesis